MCLIIRTEHDKVMTKETLQNMQRRNDDGFGFMWIQNNKIHTFKCAEDNFQLLWDKYNELKEYDPVIHLRMRTHGNVDETNTHPYYCGHGIWLMHNGVIHGVGSHTDNSKSDTWHFIDKWIKPMLDFSANPHKTIRSKGFRSIVEDKINTGNRLIFGDRGGYVLFNESTWTTVKNPATGCAGILVSNNYAWNEDQIGKKEEKKENKKKSDGPQCNTVSGFHHLKGNYYTDVVGRIWLSNGCGFMRAAHMDHAKWLWQEEMDLKKVIDEKKEEERKDKQARLLTQGVVLKREDLKEGDRCLGPCTLINKQGAPTTIPAGYVGIVLRYGGIMMDRIDVVKDAEVIEHKPTELKPTVVQEINDEDEEATVMISYLPAATANDATTNDTEEDSVFEDTHPVYAQEEYIRNLVKNWSKMDKDSIENAIYTEPSDAALVLYEMFHGDRNALLY